MDGDRPYVTKNSNYIIYLLPGIQLVLLVIGLIS
jgi:hypothetical protein